VYIYKCCSYMHVALVYLAYLHNICKCIHKASVGTYICCCCVYIYECCSYTDVALVYLVYIDNLCTCIHKASIGKYICCCCVYIYKCCAYTHKALVLAHIYFACCRVCCSVLQCVVSFHIFGIPDSILSSIMSG